MAVSTNIWSPNDISMPGVSCGITYPFSKSYGTRPSFSILVAAEREAPRIPRSPRVRAEVRSAVPRPSEARGGISPQKGCVHVHSACTSRRRNQLKNKARSRQGDCRRGTSFYVRSSAYTSLHLFKGLSLQESKTQGLFQPKRYAEALRSLCFI